MSRDEIQKLLGGYATGTLTPEEQQALFDAALDDQELFDALVREQALCDLLRDPSAKAELLAALDRQPLRWYQRLIEGWRPLAAAAAMAAVGAIAVVVWQSGRPAKSVLIAQVNPPAASTPAASLGKPAGAPATAANHALEPQAAPKPAVPEPARDQASANAQAGDQRRQDLSVRDSRLASSAKTRTGAEGPQEEDRGGNVKQAANAPKRKDAVGADSELPPVVKGAPVPLPAARPASARIVASGNGDGAKAGDSVGSVARPEQPQPAAETKTPMFRSALGKNSAGGVIGGASGGISGGVPGTPPPPPAAPTPPQTAAPREPLVQAQVAPPQAAPSPTAQQQQGQQGLQQSQMPAPQMAGAQSGQLPVSGRSELDLMRLSQQQRAGKGDALQVQGQTATVDTVSTEDAQSLFYGRSADSLTISAPAGRGGAGGGGGGSGEATRKKVAPQAEKAQAAGQTVAVNGIASNTRGGPANQLNLGVRYDLLRKTAAGFEHVEPDGVKAGETLELQLTPNESGTLLIEGRRENGGWRRVMSRNVEAHNTYLAPLRSGETEVQVTLTRLPFAIDGAALRDEKSVTGVMRESTTEPATYVVTGRASRLLQFTITLNYK